MGLVVAGHLSCCGIAASVRQAGHWSPGSLQSEPWSPFFGPGRTAVAVITSSTTAGLAVRACDWFFGDESDAHLLVVM